MGVEADVTGVLTAEVVPLLEAKATIEDVCTAVVVELEMAVEAEVEARKPVAGAVVVAAVVVAALEVAMVEAVC